MEGLGVGHGDVHDDVDVLGEVWMLWLWLRAGVRDSATTDVAMLSQNPARAEDRTGTLMSVLPSADGKPPPPGEECRLTLPEVYGFYPNEEGSALARGIVVALDVGAPGAGVVGDGPVELGLDGVLVGIAVVVGVLGGDLLDAGLVLGGGVDGGLGHRREVGALVGGLGGDGLGGCVVDEADVPDGPLAGDGLGLGVLPDLDGDGAGAGVEVHDLEGLGRAVLPLDAEHRADHEGALLRVRLGLLPQLGELLGHPGGELLAAVGVRALEDVAHRLVDTPGLAGGARGVGADPALASLGGSHPAGTAHAGRVLARVGHLLGVLPDVGHRLLRALTRLGVDLAEATGTEALTGLGGGRGFGGGVAHRSRTFRRERTDPGGLTQYLI